MAYNEQTAQRIREFFLSKNVSFQEKKMFRGLCFMVDDKMCCATSIDKKTGEEQLMCRIGEQAYDTALEKNYVVPMAFTGKIMKGYVYVLEGGLKSKPDLDYWLQLCLDFNPLAKASKK